MTVNVDTSHHVCTVTINRPEVRNALNEATVKKLIEIFSDLDTSTSSNVVVLTGQGNSAFCAGADLRELDSKKTVSEKKAFFASIAELVAKISRCSKPVIAKVHGAAVAGGLGLVASSDIVLASEDAVFALPEIKIGLAPLIVMTPLERSLPRKVLADMAFTGEALTAPRAHALGFVSRIYSAASLDTAARTFAETLASRNPDALMACKRTLYDISDEPYFEMLTQLPDRIAAVSAGEKATGGVRSFLEQKAQR